VVGISYGRIKLCQVAAVFSDHSSDSFNPGNNIVTIYRHIRSIGINQGGGITRPDC
jgi:hypothetical protein